MREEERSGAAPRDAEASEVATRLLRVLRARHPYTELHGRRVAGYAVAIGTGLGLDDGTLGRLYRGALLHDIGKLAVPLRILDHSGALTAEDWRIVQRHPEIGERICRGRGVFEDILPIVLLHHERPDGSGYPYGLREADIPLEARIVCVADIYDSLATARAYKTAFPPGRCVEILRQERDAGRLDPDALDALIAHIGVGSLPSLPASLAA